MIPTTGLTLLYNSKKCYTSNYWLYNMLHLMISKTVIQGISTTGLGSLEVHITCCIANFLLYTMLYCQNNEPNH